MEKNGRVEIGKTPDAVTGKPADKIEKGEPVSNENNAEIITERDVARHTTNTEKQG